MAAASAMTFGGSLDRRGTALVTGGAAGIGRIIALRLLADGYDVAVLDCGDEPVATDAGRHGVGRLLSVDADVADTHAVRAAFATVTGWLEVPLALLVNNAGIFPRQDAASMSHDEWSRVIDVNLTGSFLCSQAFHAAVAATPEATGSIVMVGSALASKGARDGAHYASSKAGLSGLMHSLAAAWAPRIRVNMVLPGMTDTAQLRQGGFDEASRHAVVATIPMGRLCRGGDVASAVAFLASSEASYITGQALWVNGGAFMT